MTCWETSFWIIFYDFSETIICRSTALFSVPESFSSSKTNILKERDQLPKKLLEQVLETNKKLLLNNPVISLNSNN